MQRLDGIIVDFDWAERRCALLVAEDGDFESAIRLYEKNRLINLDGKILYFNYDHIRSCDRFIFRKIKNKDKVNRFAIGMKANFDIEGNPKRPKLIVRINHKKKFKITPLYYFEDKDNDRLGRRIGRINQKVKHNLFKPWVIPFRH